MDYYGTSANTRIAAADKFLSAAGYLVTRVNVKHANECFDFSQLELEVVRNIALAIVFGCNEETIAFLSERNIPHVDFSRGIPNQKNCVGHIVGDYREAHDAFAAHCVRAGARHVVVIGKDENGHAVAGRLEERGIRVSLVKVSAPLDSARMENLERETCRAVDCLFEKNGRKWLPDVIYVEDDYQAIGALFSLLGHGVRSPEDVKFVTVKNKGGGPALAKSVTCVEHDPEAVGRAVGEAVARYLDKGVFNLDMAAMSPKYIVGETFAETESIA
jgi:DNA-binding LacI/PurR family transcriptional regulator